MTTVDRILAYLDRQDARDFPPTAREIAAALGATPSAVSTALQKLATAGKVRQIGEAANGARTWALIQLDN
jgi:DNA-binding MarR family transcriptional regulator